MSKTVKSYNRSARKYEQRWASYLSHTHRRLLSELDTGKNDVILDVSCGTGLLGEHLIQGRFPFKKLILNDIAPEMLQQAKNRLSTRGDVTFTRQNAGELQFEQQINAIICLNAFHNYDNQRLVLQRFYEVLAEGGHLYLLDWNNSGWFQAINWLIKKWVPETINSKAAEATQALLQQAGFRVSGKKEWRFRYWKLFFLKAEKPQAARSFEQ